MCLGVSVNKPLIGNLIIYIANKCGILYQTKLLKLLYLIDEESVRRTGVPITWLEYEVWAKGPVAKDVYYSKNVGENRFADYVSFSRNPNCQVITKKAFDDSEFTDNQLQIIDDVLSKYGSLSSEDLIQKTHEEGSLWSITKQHYGITFSGARKISDKVINLSQLIKDDGFKLTAYNAALESMELKAILE